MTSALELGQKSQGEARGGAVTHTGGRIPKEAPSQTLLLNRACADDTRRGCLIYPGLEKHLERPSLMKTKAFYQSRQLRFGIIREIFSRLRGRAGSVISSE